ncbi:CHASE2 domain-containing protein [Alcanivorax limicola]|uniref:CHASE2 domain-containing protein n=1 Tax=Alcanivorax limicola TaxID=2874102 RepID=UPI001CC0F1FE|nr:CHASE2 domain-containing protein [Alcanivorax limicola]
MSKLIRRESGRRYYIEHAAVLLAVAAVCAVLLHTGALMSLSRHIYDRMLPLLPEEDMQDLAIVAIDEKSLQQVGRWPWDRSVHARLVEQLNVYGARAVVLDLIFAEPDRVRPDSDAALVQAIADHGRVFLPVHVSDNGGDLIEVMPHTPFAQAAAGMGHVDVELDNDGVVRGLYMRSGIGQPWWPHLSLVLLNDLSARSVVRFPAARNGNNETLSKVQQYYRLVPFTNVRDTVPRFSAVDVLHGDVAPEALEGRIVFLGATAQGLGDLLPTPLAGRGGLMPGVEMNASVFTALRHDTLIRTLPTTWIWGLTLVLALAGPMILPLVAPRWSIPVVLAVLLGTLLLSLGMLHWLRLWFPVGPALVGAVLGYPLWTWRRLEYSLGYMRAALRRLSAHDDLNRRLLDPASTRRFLQWAEQVLPIAAWRLSRRSGGDVEQGGAPVSSHAWHGDRARYYELTSEGQQYELAVVWQDNEPTPAREQWLRAMVARCNVPAENHEQYYDVVESHIERVRAQELRQQALTRFFEASLAQLRDGVVISDACGCLLFVNAQASEWLGLPTREMDDISLLQLGRELVLSEDTDWQQLLDEAIASGRSQVECRNRRGEELYLDILRIRAGHQPGEVLILTLKDISEVKQAMRARTEMLDFLSHDLRSPMISLLALAERYSHQQQDEGVQELLAQTRYYARRSLNIAEQFLQLARAESSEEVETTMVDMLPVVESAMENVVHQAQQRDMRLRFDYLPDDEVWVNGNHELLERAVLNLLTNAIKYSEPGGSVDVRLYCDKGKVCCEVRDQGVGIEQEFLPHLFKRFSRARNAGGARTHGAGLGLRFVKVVAERHSGDIQAQSQPGEGSRFTLRLPRVEVE